MDKNEENYNYIQYPNQKDFIYKIPNQKKYIGISKYIYPERIYNTRKIIEKREIENDNYKHFYDYSYQNKRENLQYYNEENDNEFYDNNLKMNMMNSNIIKPEPYDGVLRGYNNNYSFYVSGARKFIPKITINNKYNNKNYNIYHNKNTNENQQETRYIYKNINSNLDYRNDNNYYNQIDGMPYIIRNEENEEFLYNQPKQWNINENYYIMKSNNEANYKSMENENKHYHKKAYQRNIIQRDPAKNMSKEQIDSQRLFNIRNNNNRNNIYNQKNKNNNPINRNINYKNEENQIYQKKNNLNDINFRKIYSRKLNEKSSNLYQRNNKLISYPVERVITPNKFRNNKNNNNSGISKYSLTKNRSNILDNNLSYKIQYEPYNEEEQNNYIVMRTEVNSPGHRAPLINSKNKNNDNEGYNTKLYQIEPIVKMNNKRPYLNSEVDEDDEIYEVPEQDNYYDERNQNIYIKKISSGKPFAGLNENRRKYRTYTEDITINKNYYKNNRNKNDIKRNIGIIHNREKTPVPKINKPFLDIQRFVKVNEEESIFEKSLKNIRENKEVIQAENEVINFRIRNRGSKNHRIYISNDSKRNRQGQYRTSTEILSNRSQGKYNNNHKNVNKNIIKNNNLRIIQKGNEKDISYPKYYQVENHYNKKKNFQIINNKNNNNDNSSEDNNIQNNEEEEDSGLIIYSKENNFGIAHKNKLKRKKYNNNERAYEKEEKIKKRNIISNTKEYLYQREDSPHDKDEYYRKKKKKYYDNHGYYLDEKNIMHKKQISSVIPKFRPEYEFVHNQQEEDEGEEFEEQEENENSNNNNYGQYLSNNKNKINMEKFNYPKDKIQSYEYNNNNKFDEKNKNVFVIQSQNLHVYGQYENDKEKQEDEDDEENDNDKEADEQHIEDVLDNYEKEETVQKDENVNKNEEENKIDNDNEKNKISNNNEKEEEIEDRIEEINEVEEEDIREDSNE